MEGRRFNSGQRCRTFQKGLQIVLDPSIDQLTKLMEALNRSPEADIDLPAEFEIQLARLYKKLRKRKRRASGSARKKADRATVVEIANRRKQNHNQVRFEGDAQPVQFQHQQRTCYCCNERYQTVHPFYHWLCVACGDRSAAKRTQEANLSNYCALVTGGRIKIGFEVAVWLLQCGAKVHVTTRFPADAAIRFSELPDFAEFEDRLLIHQLDFRNLPAVMSFIDHLNQNESQLDILINLAAQSVKRSNPWHQNRIQFEQQANLSHNQQKLISFSGASDELRLLSTTENSNPSVPCTGDALLTRDDDDRLDTREKNTWNSTLNETEPVEILEALLVNANAPALLTRGLHARLQASPNPDRFVINVTGADGIFSLTKSGYHAHVNMSKAALNMLTRSCARLFARDNIWVNSVDTGWITHEGGVRSRKQRQEQGFLPPYDHRDGAARILDPIFQVVNREAEPVGGVLFRNFQAFNW